MTRPRARSTRPLAGANSFNVASTVALIQPGGSRVPAAETAAKSAIANTGVACNWPGRKVNASCTGISTSTAPGAVCMNARPSVRAMGMDSTMRSWFSKDVAVVVVVLMVFSFCGWVGGRVCGRVWVCAVPGLAARRCATPPRRVVRPRRASAGLFPRCVPVTTPPCR